LATPDFSGTNTREGRRKPALLGEIVRLALGHDGRSFAFAFAHPDAARYADRHECGNQRN
jgi:hypothetical protein